MIIDVKQDGHVKARLVIGGHVLDADNGHLFICNENHLSKVAHGDCESNWVSRAVQGYQECLLACRL